MEIIRGLHNYRFIPNALLAIGTFDGVHLGHQRILNSLVMKSKEVSGVAVVLTFDFPPKFVLNDDRAKECSPMLTPFNKKEILFAELGVDYIIEQKFTHNFSLITREKFIDDIILKKIRPTHLFVGHDFRFGYKREGDVDFLKQRLQEGGVELIVVPPVTIDGQRVSSSFIRELIARGAVDVAKKYLGRYYSIYGTVEYGSKLATALGFPTANVKHYHALTPSPGVYAVHIEVLNSSFDGIAYVGSSPTFNLKRKKVEVHIFNFRGILYERPIKIDFVKKIRDEIKFKSTHELINQIKKDIMTAREYLSR